jgi:hypothetical protein
MKNFITILTILALEAFLGIMINIGLSYIVHWQSLDPIEFMATFKVDYPLLLLPMFITLLPAFLGCLWLVINNPKKSEIRKYWVYCLICIVMIILQTLVFHLPKNLSFIASSYTALEAQSNFNGWMVSHWIRVIIALAAGIFAIIGFKKQIENSVRNFE